MLSSIILGSILAKMPKEYDEFRSCFFGDGELFFNLPAKGKRWINDIDKDIVDFYKQVQKTPNKEIICPHKINFGLLRSITSMSKYLKSVAITRYCATALLKIPGKNVFCFLDPPNFPDTEDHKKLAEVVKETEHMVLMDCQDNELIRSLYLEEDGFYLHEKNGELLIVNYEVEDEGVVKLF